MTFYFFWSQNLPTSRSYMPLQEVTEKPEGVTQNTVSTQLADKPRRRS